MLIECFDTQGPTVILVCIRLYVSKAANIDLYVFVEACYFP